MTEIHIILTCILALMLLSAVAGIACALRPVRSLGIFATPFTDLIKERKEARKASKKRKKNKNKEPEPSADSSSDSYVITDDDDESPRLKSIPHTTDPALLPSVSVIVYSFVNEEIFSEYLDKLMLQNYPDFEVVVVYDATADAATELADRFMNRYSRLHLTFIPPGTHNLSRRKLALTLGIKAAQSDIVITTAANAEIPSRDWLYSMMEPFADPSVDIVLGASHLRFDDFKGSGRWYRQFDSVLSKASWIYRAIKGSPYRGDASNMAFRRQLFFDCNGYADTIGKPYGEDDVFLCKIANSGNTRVVLSPASLLTMEWGPSACRTYDSIKEHHIFADRMLPKGQSIRAGLIGSTAWITLLCALAVIPISLLSSLFGITICDMTGAPGFAADPLASIPWEGAAAFLILIIFQFMQILSYRKGCVSLEAVRLWWAVPLFILWRPIGNFIFKFRHRKARFMNFVWNGYQ